ncbi:MAG: high-potential iron-sulfur protein [Sulfuriferula sp.]
MEDIKNQPVSRRSFLKGAALLASISVVPALVVSKEAAAAKTPKAAMQYQDSPKNGAECSTCVQFIPGKKGQCKIIEGDISPKGWCLAYAKA